MSEPKPEYTTDPAREAMQAELKRLTEAQINANRIFASQQEQLQKTANEMLRIEGAVNTLAALLEQLDAPKEPPKEAA